MQTKHLRCTLCCLFTLSAQADEAVREMSTDRPDITESPYSVAPGFFQVEMSFYDYQRDHSGSARSETQTFGQVNLKYGIGENTDLQLVFDSYTRADDANGFGDLTVRLKQNLWGNDKGGTAFALMPYLTVPTYTAASQDAWSGGLVAPFAYSLSERVNLGVQAQLELSPDEDRSGHHLDALVSGTIGYSMTDQLGGFAELVGIFSEEESTVVLFDIGFTCAVSDHLSLDAGARIGLNRAAPDLGLFSGMSFRF